MKGIDVAHYQGIINWFRVKSAGVDFAFIKATQGTSFTDPLFKANIQGATRAGLTVGAYHFFDPTKDATAQAMYFLKTINGLGDMMVALDLEPTDGWDNLSDMDRAEAVNNWLDTVQEALKTKPFIYTDVPFANKYLGPVPLGLYPLWLARYAPTVPPGWSGYTIWQDTEDSKVDGVGSYVDGDIFNGDSLAPYLAHNV